ncbi:BLUF domain-containing protein [Psychroserpens damuponensis]|uniref:BLUF domain-containing protein n=1 Tax=Psychroserpens damuponensis TaxID=943936 RepID=UPI0006935254|nr:BLUF domain-containing protein [Psychroserpens damuponensis]
MPYTIIYQSKANKNLQVSEIDAMLLKAKRFNKARHITGCIVYHNHQFIQIIEGEKSEIINLYAKIKKDSRHNSVLTLVETATTQTLWDDWSMAFYKFTGDAIKDQNNRMLLEIYFNTAKRDQQTSKVFKILKESILQLLQAI